MNLAVLTSFVLALASTAAHGQSIFKCKDDKGQAVFQHYPCAESMPMQTAPVRPDRQTAPARPTAQPHRPPNATQPAAQISPAAASIRAKCARDWPDNFRMRVFCEDQQFKALQTLDQPLDAGPNEAAVIRSKCARDWPDNFRMRAFCEEQQVEALKELQRR